MTELETKITYLTNAAKDFISAWQRWRAEGLDLCDLTPPFQKAIKTICLTFTDETQLPIPSLLSAVGVAVEKLMGEFAFHAAKLETADEHERVFPHAEFWAAVESVEDELRKLPKPSKYFPPPAKELVKMKASGIGNATVCKMFGFADVSELQTALENPQSYFGENWRWPDQRRQAEEAAAEQASFETGREAWLAKKNAAMDEERAAAPVAATTAPRKNCPESIAELLRLPNMRPEQVARMRGISMAELQKYLDTHDVPNAPALETSGSARWGGDL